LRLLPAALVHRLAHGRSVIDAASVVVLDDFRTGKRANLAHHAGSDRLEIVACDVSHGSSRARALTAKHGPVERIVHLAARSRSCTRSPTAVDMQGNYGGTLPCSEYAARDRRQEVVFASSAAVYGDVTTMPVGEDTPTRPVSPYGIDKARLGHALDYYAASTACPATALRFFNVYGPAPGSSARTPA